MFCFTKIADLFFIFYKAAVPVILVTTGTSRNERNIDFYDALSAPHSGAAVSGYWLYDALVVLIIKEHDFSPPSKFKNCFYRSIELVKLIKTAKKNLLKSTPESAFFGFF